MLITILFIVFMLVCLMIAGIAVIKTKPNSQSKQIQHKETPKKITKQISQQSPITEIHIPNRIGFYDGEMKPYIVLKKTDIRRIGFYDEN